MMNTHTQMTISIILSQANFIKRQKYNWEKITNPTPSTINSAFDYSFVNSKISKSTVHKWMFKHIAPALNMSHKLNLKFHMMLVVVVSMFRLSLVFCWYSYCCIFHISSSSFTRFHYDDDTNFGHTFFLLSSSSNWARRVIVSIL